MRGSLSMRALAVGLGLLVGLSGSMSAYGQTVNVPSSYLPNIDADNSDTDPNTLYYLRTSDGGPGELSPAELQDLQDQIEDYQNNRPPPPDEADYNMDPDDDENEIAQYNADYEAYQANSQAGLEAIINAAFPDGTGSGLCVEQLDPVAFGLDVAGLATDFVGIGLEAASLGIPGLEVPGIVTQGVGVGLALGSTIVQGIQLGLPNCEAEFTGSVVSYASIISGQGMSAYGGAISIGNPDLESYQLGISIGGGAIAGAGNPDPLALSQTGAISAIAIGNYARAMQANTTAIGEGAVAGNDPNISGINATAIGANSSANYANSAAFGAGATATMANQQVFGTAANTHTMAGIGNDASQLRQTGKLGLVTADRNGNLAMDSELYEQIGENRQGVAMAMALGNFWVPHDKNFAFAVNASTWDGTWAIGANIGGAIGDSMHVSGGLAISEEGLIAGRIGGQVSW